MLTHKQTQFAVPEKTEDGGWKLPPADVMGNCFATCVACLLDLDPSVVPNFAAKRGDWWASFQDWLVERGYFAIEIDHKNPDEPAAFWPLPGDVLCIINGKSPRGDYTHSVIGKTEVVDAACRQTRFVWVHDPHPSNEWVGEVRSITFVVPMPRFDRQEAIA